jgi:hypothetical protein
MPRGRHPSLEASSARCRLGHGKPVVKIQITIWKWLLVLGPILVLAFGYKAFGGMRPSPRPDQDDISRTADRVTRLAEAYIARVATVTSVIAISPQVVRLAEEASNRPTRHAMIERIDTAWRKPAGQDQEATRAYADLAGEPVSIFLRDLKASTGLAYRELLLSDNKGRLVAASNRTEDYFQADDEWWPPDLAHFRVSCRRGAADCASLSDVKWDPSAAGFGFDVILPVMTTHGSVVGVLKAVVDPQELDTLLQIVDDDEELDVALIRANGSRVFSTDSPWGSVEQQALVALPPGAEMSLKVAARAEDGPILVRRLTGAPGRLWSVAVAIRPRSETDEWKISALWISLTLAMFFVAANAFAIAARADQVPSEPKPEATTEG